MAIKSNEKLLLSTHTEYGSIDEQVLAEVFELPKRDKVILRRLLRALNHFARVSLIVLSIIECPYVRGAERIEQILAVLEILSLRIFLALVLGILGHQLLENKPLQLGEGAKAVTVGWQRKSRRVLELR